MGIAIGALALAAAVQAAGDLEPIQSATIVDLVPLPDGKRFCLQGPDPLCFEAEVLRRDTAWPSSDDDPNGWEALSAGTVRRHIFVTGPQVNPDEDWRWPLVLPQWLEDPDHSPALSIWPQIVELPAPAGAVGGAHMLIGVIATTSRPYSGGGATS